MQNADFPFEMRDSKFVPGLRSLAIKQGRVTYISPIETRPNNKMGGTYKIATVNLMLTVPGASGNAFLTAKVMGTDATVIEQGLVNEGDMVTCLISFDTHRYNGVSYQDVYVKELETIHNA